MDTNIRNKLRIKCVTELVSNETRQRLSEVNFGRQLSDETKKKMSIAGKGKKFSEETRFKISIALKGKPKSIEHNRKMSLSKIGKSVNRNRDKWPCPDGNRCKCDDCKKKKNAYLRNLRNKEKLSNFIMIQGVVL